MPHLLSIVLTYRYIHNVELKVLMIQLNKFSKTRKIQAQSSTDDCVNPEPSTSVLLVVHWMDQPKQNVSKCSSIVYIFVLAWIRPHWAVRLCLKVGTKATLSHKLSHEIKHRNIKNTSQFLYIPYGSMQIHTQSMVGLSHIFIIFLNLL